MSEVRLSKLMSEMGLGSRSEADRLIETGQVFVDGVAITQLGTRISPDSEITLSTAARQKSDRLMTIILNKPPGYVSGQAERGYPDAVSLITRSNLYGPKDGQLPRLGSLNVAGRLDIDSSGLLVLTQDGRVARQLIGPNSKIKKSYRVKVHGHITPNCLEQLRFDLELDGRTLRRATVQQAGEDGLLFELIEGRKRQIRRMCQAVGLDVRTLHRNRVGAIKLGQLPRGCWRFLSTNELF